MIKRTYITEYGAVSLHEYEEDWLNYENQWIRFSQLVETWKTEHWEKLREIEETEKLESNCVEKIM